ncbi:MAG: pectinesterase family protein [Anaerolineae bacterium]
MNAMKRIIQGVSLVLAVALAFVTVRAASSSQDVEPRAAEALVGTGFTYQGQLKLDGTPVTDTCDMEFSLYADAAGTSLVGSTIVSLPVSVVDGLFAAELDFGSDAFNGQARWLGIQVQCTADASMINLGLQPLTATPYALSAPWSGLSGVPAGFADNVDNNTTYSAGTGLDLDHGVFSILTPNLLPAPCDPGEVAKYSTKSQAWYCSTDATGPDPSKVVIVAKSGGDYTTIQAAIDSISTAAADNPYLLWVAPGIYEEQVTMAPYIHLQGAGQGATVITKSDTEVTLYLAAYTSLRDLTVINDSTFYDTYALRAEASDNVMGTLVADVEAQALQSGTNSHGCTLDGADTSVTLLDVTAHAQGGNYSYALEVLDGATAILEGGSYTADESAIRSYAISSSGFGTTLEATDVRAVADNTSGGSRGLVNGGTAILRGGLYSAHGASTAYGIHNSGSYADLEAYSVTAEAVGVNQTYGLNNDGDASANLYGGSFTARDGSYTAGLYLSSSSNALVANGISALGEDATSLDYGVDHNGGSCTISHSVLEGAYRSAYTNPGTLRLSHTRLLGNVGGGPTCLGVSTDTDFYAEECPPYAP